MKPKELVALAVSIIIGIAIVFLLQYPLLSDDLTLSSLTSEIDGIEFWKNVVLQPLLLSITIISLLFIALWIGIATTKTFTRSRDAYAMRATWFILAIVLFIIYEVLLLVFGYTSLLSEGSLPLQLNWLIQPLLFLDLILLFWLPTALATPRALRYVPPLSMKIRSLIGG
ncbi:hypothetical protein [Synechococcus elongatus]|uniref:hypothetical protein n=1 Tax=Synechococcus elongatus TaxID=32046 RepID=UPI000F7DE8DB|nr:hypothetical protein [Synechococcus elongatus]